MRRERSYLKALLWVSLFIQALTQTAVIEALAQEEKYPQKPVQIVVPMGPGGAIDIAMRFISGVIPEYLGQPVVVINKAGASGAIGMEYIIKQAKPDGYTMMGATVGPNAIFPARFLKLPFNWEDLTYVARLQLTPMILAVRSDSPFKTLNDLLNYIKNNPKKLKFGTGGVQTTQNVGPHILMNRAKIPYDYVSPLHYEGGGEANLALLRGDVDFIYNLASSTKPHVKAGKLRGLLVPSKIDDLPDVPTSQELGFPDVNMTGWQAICGPPKLPKYVINKWTDCIKKTMDNNAWQKMIEGVGDTPAYLGPDELKSFVTTEVNRYREIFKELGLLKDTP